MHIHKLKKPQRPDAEISQLQALFNKVLALAKAKSSTAIADLYLDEGIDISQLRIYGDSILSTMAYEINLPKVDILNADLRHEFNTLIQLYRHLLEGIMPPLMPNAPAVDGELYVEIPNDEYKREILVGLLKRGDRYALDLDVMDEKFYLKTCGRFGMSDVIGWYLVAAVDTKLKNLGFHIAQFSAAALDTKFILNHAIKGYALGGFIQKVENFLTSGADINNALAGYAEAGYTTQVNQLLTRKAHRNAAVKGYIASGIFHKLEDLLLKEPALINTAVTCLKAKDNCFYTLFYKIAKSNPDYQRIMVGREKALLRIIAPLNNADLRQQLAEKILRAGAQFNDLAALLNAATAINKELQQGKTFEESFTLNQKAPLY